MVERSTGIGAISLRYSVRGARLAGICRDFGRNWIVLCDSEFYDERPFEVPSVHGATFVKSKVL